MRRACEVSRHGSRGQGGVGSKVLKRYEGHKHNRISYRDKREGGTSKSILHSHQQKCCALPYENTVVPLQYVDGVSTARKAPKRNE